MSNVAVEEKRKYIRLNYVIPATIGLSKNNRSVVFQGFCRNISRGGMGIEINRSTVSDEIKYFKNNSLIQVDVELPRSDKRISVKGHIRWLKDDCGEDKIIFGIEFSPDTQSAQPLILFNHAKKEIYRQRSGKKWFIIFLLSTIALSVWGVQLHFENTALMRQIHQLDSMRISLEEELMSLREDKFSAETYLRRANEKQSVLVSRLYQLQAQTRELNEIINGLKQQLNNTSEDSTSEQIAQLKQIIEDKTALNAFLEERIEFIQDRLDENNQDVVKINAEYDGLSKAFHNRLKAKKLLDDEISTLVKKARMPVAKLGNSGYTSLPRSMMVLTPELFKFRPRTDELLAFCDKKNINLIFSKINLDNSLTPDQYPKFLMRAHNQGIKVHAYYVLNYSDRSDSEKVYKAYKHWIAQILSFNKKQDDNSRFDGINIEIDTTHTTPKALAEYKRYIKSLDGLVRARNSKNSSFKIGVTVTQATNDTPISLVYKDKSAHINIHLIDIADYIVIEQLQSRKSAKEEIKYAGLLDKKVYLGQQLKVSDPSYNPADSGQYIHTLESEISKIIEYYLDEPGFMGVAIHNYSAYRQCIDDNTPEYIKDNRSPVISVRPPMLDYESPMMNMKK